MTLECEWSVPGMTPMPAATASARDRVTIGVRFLRNWEKAPPAEGFADDGNHRSP